jgi:hypothetical protein
MNGVNLARRTLVLASSSSAKSTLTGDSTTRTSTSHTNASGVLLDDNSDDENEIIDFAGESAGPKYMSRHPISSRLVLADVEEFEEALVEAMEEKIQANTDNSNAVAHTEKQCEVLLSQMSSGNLICLPSPPEDWVAPAPKAMKGEPVFIEVDNP